MPFVKKNDAQGSQPPTNARDIFIGRTGELLFFVQNILKPIDPTHNIISISGQGGVGKSTMLARFIDETFCLPIWFEGRVYSRYPFKTSENFDPHQISIMV